jgi:hypothetical protein
MMLSLGCMEDVRERPTPWHSEPLSIFQTCCVLKDTHWVFIYVLMQRDESC